MCDEQTVEDDAAYLATNGQVSRRFFGVMSMAAALAACATTAAETHDVVEQDVSITTPDGVCDAYFVHPASGRHPGVLVWPDILGLRPAFRVMGKRLAEAGYSVLVVNPFYRSARSPVVAEGASFTDPAIRERLMSYTRVFTPDTQVSDASVFVRFLDQQPAVDTRRKIGTTGYCMGGAFTMRTAAALPDRVGAAGSFHGGGLVTDAPSSPHLLIPIMRANYLICIAQNDDQNAPTVKDTLRQSFAAAHLPAEIEVYAANHGWCALDSAVYNEAEAERAWSRLLNLFATALA